MTNGKTRRGSGWLRILLIGIAFLVALFAGGLTFAWWYDHVGQRSDPEFVAKIAHAAYAAESRTVEFDAAHNNFHTASGRYRPFAELLRADGLSVRSNQAPFAANSFRGVDLVVIANAMGPDGKEGSDPFSNEEKKAIVDWVGRGGALLLIADHAPFGGAAKDLAARFGVIMHLLFARDDRNHDGWDNERLLFSRDNGLLPSNTINDGRDRSERVQTVVSFTGQSLSGPPQCARILPLGVGAYDWESRKVRYPAAGHSQALACRFGTGRLFVLGEAAMFSAQVDPLGYKFGMNRRGNDDRQFALNVVHWLLPPLQKN